MLNIAIIGTGNISPAHINAYLAFPNRCKIVALCDIYPEKAQSKKDEYNLTNAIVVDSHKKLLGRKDIDLVSVCTPPYVHAEIAIDFLDDGKHVILEKPMAPSLEECDKIIEAEKRSDKILACIAQNRFFTPVMNVKKILDKGLIGKVVHAQVDSHWWRGHCYYDLWWRGCWDKEGGGCTLNHAVHHIDMLGWMMGMPSKVTAVLANTSHDNAEIEDLSVAIMQYPNNALAQVTSSVVHHGEEQQIIFQGEDARISAPWKVYASTTRTNGFPNKNQDLMDKLNRVYNDLEELKHVGHEGEIVDVLTAIEEGHPPLICGEDGRRTIELITAIYKAGSLGETITLPLNKDDSFYTIDGIIKNATHFYEKSGSIENFSDNKISTAGNYGK